MQVNERYINFNLCDFSIRSSRFGHQLYGENSYFLIAFFVSTLAKQDDKWFDQNYCCINKLVCVFQGWVCTVSSSIN
ncbi:hypothetical protein DBZ36_12615 [Alginatibacterium sediminis]|uniref:Uncharacterized protein n=1 Tax=Alginatibacterium sediminis TaxID=2164068 RepID=A0A420EBM0_9ALTE|nr:hypothetical protein DBZ36_12615 [Alginatibacterium sediminis]